MCAATLAVKCHNHRNKLSITLREDGNTTDFAKLLEPGHVIVGGARWGCKDRGATRLCLLSKLLIRGHPTRQCERVTFTQARAWSISFDFAFKGSCSQLM